MVKKHTPSDADFAAFRKISQHVKPLPQDKIPLKPKANKIRPPAAKPDLSEPPDPLFYFDPHQSLLDDPIQPDDRLAYRDPSLSVKLFRKLGKGQYNVQAVLDLHGKTATEAQIALENFLRTSVANGIRVVLIIHGKGHLNRLPVLKNHLYRWLQQLPMILAFRSADKKDGGHGALYVLLRRERV